MCSDNPRLIVTLYAIYLSKSSTLPINTLTARNVMKNKQEMLLILTIMLRQIRHAWTCNLKYVKCWCSARLDFKKELFCFQLKNSFTLISGRKISGLYLYFIERKWKWNCFHPLTVLSILCIFDFVSHNSIKVQKQNINTFD